MSTLITFQPSDFGDNHLFCSGENCPLATAIKRQFKTDDVHIGFCSARIDGEVHHIWYKNDVGFYEDHHDEIRREFANGSTEKFTAELVLEED